MLIDKDYAALRSVVTYFDAVCIFVMACYISINAVVLVSIL